MGQIASEEYFEVKRALETFITENNDLMNTLAREVAGVRKEVHTLNKIFGRATQEIEQASKKKGKV